MSEAEITWSFNTATVVAVMFAGGGAGVGCGTGVPAGEGEVAGFGAGRVIPRRGDWAAARFKAMNKPKIAKRVLKGLINASF